jgi:predicted alpha-1,6-mannanase (GH76 family)
VKRVLVAALSAVLLLVTPSVASAHRHPRDTPADRAAAAVQVLANSYDPTTGIWPTSWWNSAVALTTVEDYQARTGDTQYEWMINNTYQLDKGSFPAGTRSSDPILGDFESRAIDDTEWWGLAWVRAYDVTGDQTYLDEAVTIANYVDGYWDDTCGGGVWWDAERTYKNAVTNGLWIRLTAELHNRIADDTEWLDRAQTAWNWYTASGLINSSNLVNDGLDTSTCTNNGQTVWSYNQGLAIGGAVELYRATGDASVLATAEALADAGTSNAALVTNGILTESCDTLTASCDDNQKQFKGVFMRYLMDLSDVTGSYQSFVQTQADTIWSQDRDASNNLGERWSGTTSTDYPNVFDWRTQASALSALIAAVPAS